MILASFSKPYSFSSCKSVSSLPLQHSTTNIAIQAPTNEAILAHTGDDLEAPITTFAALLASGVQFEDPFDNTPVMPASTHYVFMERHNALYDHLEMGIRSLQIHIERLRHLLDRLNNDKNKVNRQIMFG